jgi:ribose transport system ATP-binding protein
MKHVSKRFGPTVALQDVSLAAFPGEVLALVGENGAGKSTLMKILSGALAADAGQMTLVGRPYRPRGPQDARHAGVAMIYQELNIAPELSVEDNVLLGQEHSRWGLLDRSTGRRDVRQALERLGHADLDLNIAAGRLSVGMQQLVEIARSLVTNAKVVVLDEPTSSLTQHDVQKLFEVVRRLKDEGLAVIYISHFLEEIRQVADRYAVLRDGRAAGTGRLADVSDSEIVSLMVGRTVDQLFPEIPHEMGEVVLSLAGLCGGRAPSDVSLDLRRGEILGIAGLVGAGRTELLRSIYALDPVRRGEVLVANIAPPATPKARIRAGLGFVSEDRKGEGLAQLRSVVDNVTLSCLRPYSRCGWLTLGVRQSAVEQWAQRLQIRLRSVEQPVSALSGGNQQKVALARVLHQDADVLLLDEPTRGIDVGTKAEIYRLMGQLAARGKAILFVSSYLPELMAICDRIGVMSRGRLRDLRPVSAWTEDSVMACAIELE